MQHAYPLIIANYFDPVASVLKKKNQDTVTWR